MNDIQLSQHFTVAELCNLKKYPKNIPTIQQITSMTYGCRHLLESFRAAKAFCLGRLLQINSYLVMRIQSVSSQTRSLLALVSTET